MEEGVSPSSLVPAIKHFGGGSLTKEMTLGEYHFQIFLF